MDPTDFRFSRIWNQWLLSFRCFYIWQNRLISHGVQEVHSHSNCEHMHNSRSYDMRSAYMQKVRVAIA